MCGIVALVSKNNKCCIEDTLACLQNLEYRGYDSSGIATIQNKEIVCVKTANPVSILTETISSNKPKLSGNLAISHTRWATHGRASEENAHPHCSNNIAIVHNGIINNSDEIKETLPDFNFTSDTDTEIALALIVNLFHTKKLDELTAITTLLKTITGSFAAVILFGETGNMYAIRLKSPMAIGTNEDTIAISSDITSLRQLNIKQIIYLENEEIAKITKDKLEFFNFNGDSVQKQPAKFSPTSESTITAKGEYETFMLKEIYEQPTCIQRCIDTYLRPDNTIHFPQCSINFADFTRFVIISCGTSFYSGLIMKNWLESVTSLDVFCELSSEFNCKEHNINTKKTLYIFISQSGETADTLVAMSYIDEHKSPDSKILSIINTPYNSMIKLSKDYIESLSGTEIGVAATKSFTGQLCTLALVVAKYCQSTKAKYNINEAIDAIRKIPSSISQFLTNSNTLNEIKNTAQQLAKDMKILGHKNLIFTGRAEFYCLSLEAALKTQELSYLISTPVSSGELKHGPMSLLDQDTNVIMLAHSSTDSKKMINTMQEINARDAKIILFSDVDHDFIPPTLNVKPIALKEFKTYNLFATSICYAIPIHLLSYYIAKSLGNNIDKPRGLAKSVTVE